MSNEIECQSITKKYNGIRALDEFDLHIDVSEPTGLVGANGAGKSTLFSILCGFIRPNSGKVRLLDAAPSSASLIGKIAILPQDTAMYKNISVQAQLCHFARLQGFSYTAARQQADRVLSLVNAIKLAKQYPETLSFGQRKKIMLAQALIGEPRLLLLDEPTSGLDPVATREIHKLLEQLARSYSLMISSHNLGEIEGICQNIVIINRGKLVKTGSINDIKRVRQCFRLRLENISSVDLTSLFGNLVDISAVEADTHDPRRYQVFYREGKAHEVQMAVLSELNKLNIEIAEMSKGTALADEISSLLKS